MGNNMDIKQYRRTSGLYFNKTLDLRKRSDIKELPNYLFVTGSLDLEGTQIEKLPEGLTVMNNLSLRKTKIKELPEDLLVAGNLFLKGSSIENYPLVHNCGSLKRTIYLDLRDKSIIRMGCFKGTEEQALLAVHMKYESGDLHDRYCNQVIKCFKLRKEYGY